LGWVKTQTWDWRGALDIAQRDSERERLSPAWQVNLATAEACCGQWHTAERLITEAYEANATLKDRFTNLGWLGYSFGQGAEYLRQLADRDTQHNRSSTEGRRAAVLNGIAAGEADQAIQAAESLYAEVPASNGQACHLLALIGSRLYVNRGAYQEGCELFARDFAQGRLTADNWKALYALVLASCGERDQALEMLDTQLALKVPQGVLALPTYHRPGTVAMITLEELRALLIQGGQYTDVIEQYAVTATGVASLIDSETPAQNGEIRLLSKQMRLKFGDLPPWAQAQLHASTSQQRDCWAERILTEETLEAVFESLELGS
jgi:tetratricopeptide (TPR) repeat protein